MIKPTVKEFTLITTMLSMREIGLKINKMDLVLRVGPMDQCLRVFDVFLHRKGHYKLGKKEG